MVIIIKQVAVHPANLISYGPAVRDEKALCLGHRQLRPAPLTVVWQNDTALSVRSCQLTAARNKEPDACPLIVAAVGRIRVEPVKLPNKIRR